MSQNLQFFLGRPPLSREMAGVAKEQNIAFIRLRVFPNKQQNECPEETYLRIALVKIFRCIFALFEFTSFTV